MKKYRILSILLLIALLLSLSVPVFATETEDTEPETTELISPEDLPQGFGKPEPLRESIFPTTYKARAKAAVLVELNSNTIVFGQDMDQKLYPASLTKIMTCMLALEHGNLDDVLTVSDTALQNLNIYGSTVGLLEGEQISLRELLYCIMISSANEGCNVIAEHISGSIDSFVKAMNAKAAEIGMKNTNFANTHGLHDDNHYTTAYDLAVLGCWAWQNMQFREFSTATEHTVPATNLSGERFLQTTNHLTSTAKTSRYFYENAKGIKTGFTTPAGGCLISTASNGELAFLSVVCGCETLYDAESRELDMRFLETADLFDFGFRKYDFVQVLSDLAMLEQCEVRDGLSNRVLVHAAESKAVLLPVDYDPELITLRRDYLSGSVLQAPLSEGQKVGTVTAFYGDIPLESADLVTLNAVGKHETALVEAKEGGDTGIWAGLLDYWYLTIPFALVLLLVILLLIIRAVNVHRAKKRAKRRRRNATRRRTYD